ncbi:peptidyl-prolyl cis-trans isomerase FKBP13, chloroplastic isoform X2 [Spinacia oleracea]|uniref:peptidylprolyl isomerase n=1 Tax=Spinacia oleracea TaxID=3562 RepID=A0ABM3RE92_SPIOL|nr:peptidyl-prolyl cis-trans isomerase FKBP13, chloroplastic isoform X2 [Spinacia oleracea]
MKSLALLSPAFFSPKTHNTNNSYLLLKNLDKKHCEASATRAEHREVNECVCVAEIEKPNSLRRRREVIGIGASIGLLLATILLPSQFAEAEAEAEAEASCEFIPSPSGLAYCDKLVGTGPQPSKGRLIKAHYVGKLENGKVFDSSYNRGKPLTFRVGVGEVIKGWDAGILGSEGVPPMLAGGKRTLMIPPELGYGMRGAGCKGGTCIIPPNSTLFFEVEFVGNV